MIGASAVTDTHGKRIARVGDQVTCPKKGHGRVTTIATGDPTFIVDGSPVARHGDLCACGAQLLAGQYATDVQEGTGEASLAGTAADMELGGEVTNVCASAVDGDHSYVVRFQALDECSGAPLAHTPYFVTRADGTQHGGVTDAEGMTAPIESGTSQDVSVHFSFRSELDTVAREDLR